MRINRRALLGGGAMCVLSSRIAVAAPDPEKTRFMKEAIQSIKDTVAKLPPLDPRPLEIRTVCVPYPFSDFDFYYTRGILWWTPNPGQTLNPVIVPEGFCTDLTSVPRAFWSVYPRTGRYAYAAIAHDFLYWTQSGTREEADNVLFEAMQDTQVDSVTTWAIYGMVRKFGQSSWESNAKAKAEGQKRFLKVFPPAGQLTSWADWKTHSTRFSD